MGESSRGMLKVVSILFIVFGAIATVFSIIGLAGSAWLSSATGGLAGILVVATILALILSVLELIIGIIGLKKSNDASPGGFFVTTGIILCVLALISIIMSFNVITLIGLVLPVLYIIGGSQLKKA